MAGSLARLVVLIPAIGGIAFARPRLTSLGGASKGDADFYALPPASALPSLSLGYRAALADYLFTSTIVSYGMHGEEHRRFEHVGDYLDAIVELDPTFREPYRMADTLIIFQATGSPSLEDVHHARRIVDRGLEERPDDGALWLSAGQFMAFIATQFLPSEEEKTEYRSAGARALARAGELGGASQNIQWQALAAAGIFTRAGERSAAIGFLQRVYAVTDDDQLRATVAGQLNALQEEANLELARQKADAFNTAWRADLPFASRTRMLVVGPRWDVAQCAGKGALLEAECAQTWEERGRGTITGE